MVTISRGLSACMDEIAGSGADVGQFRKQMRGRQPACSATRRPVVPPCGLTLTAFNRGFGVEERARNPCARNWRDGSLTSWTSTLGGVPLHRLFLSPITLIAISLMLRDGTWLANRSVVTARRLLGDPGICLIGKIADATRATVNGTFAAPIVKGAVVGIAYVVMGVPGPLPFSAMTIVLARVPLGAWVALAAVL
jgi:hypothetical protein